jgi:hypothetical protein
VTNRVDARTGYLMFSSRIDLRRAIIKKIARLGLGSADVSAIRKSKCGRVGEKESE